MVDKTPAQIGYDATTKRIKGRFSASAHFAEPLLPMVRAGMGLAWLPLSLVEQDLSHGKLVRAWLPEQDIRFEVRLVRVLHNENAIVERVWAVS